MEIYIKRESDVPVYIQIKNQISEMIFSGRLKAGFALPPERKLADSLGVNRSTVFKAYQELKADGLVSAHVGKGTVILPQLFEKKEINPRTVYPIQWNQFFNRSIQLQNGDLIKNMLELAGRSSTTSFTAGLPSPDLFPQREMSAIMQELAQEQSGSYMANSPTDGLQSLKESVCRLMEEREIKANPRETIILTGSQQGLDFTARCFLSPGDVIVTEEPTYLGALNIFRSYGARVIGVPVDQEGMRTDMLEALLSRYRPKLIYTLPTFQNPSGTVMSMERRLALLDMSYRYMVPVLEDDPYYELRYEGSSLPPLKALDQHGYVIYLSTFSKVLFMGFRLGWAAAARPVIEKFGVLKQISDLHTSTLSQVMTDKFIRKGYYHQHRKVVCCEYQSKRDLMDNELRKGEALGIKWHKPEGGFYIWCGLPENISQERLIVNAGKRQVAFVPGEAFYPAGDQFGSHVRLNFSYADKEEIVEGIKRFLLAVQDTMQEGNVFDAHKYINKPIV